MNIFEDYHTRDSVFKKELKSIDTTQNSFFYSPAHMEELAVILRKEPNEELALQYIWDKLVTISEVTNNLEFLPSNTSIIMKKEHPTICFKRVIDHYEATLIAEENEAFVFSSRNQESLNEYYEEDVQGIDTFSMIQTRFAINKRALNNIAPNKLFSTPEVMMAFDALMTDFGYTLKTLEKWNVINNNYSYLTSIISLLYNFLEKIGYKSEKKTKLRSRMHDVSHGIYATASDILVTRDERFYKKTKAIYCLLEIPTMVYNKDEFTTYVLQTNNK